MSTDLILDLDHLILGPELAEHGDWIILYGPPDEGVGSLKAYGTFESWTKATAYAIGKLNLSIDHYAVVPLEKVAASGVGHILLKFEVREDGKSIAALGVWPTYEMLATWAVQNKDTLGGWSDFYTCLLEIVTR